MKSTIQLLTTCNQIQRTKALYVVIQLHEPSSQIHVPFVFQKYLKWCHFWISFGNFILVFFSAILLQVLGSILLYSFKIKDNSPSRTDSKGRGRVATLQQVVLLLSCQIKTPA